MSEIKVNKISPRTACGTTTLGDSGDTFTIPAGVSITNSGTASGFGATGAVSWNTTVKTSGFTAVAGEGYFVNTTSGGITVNLPAGTPGAVVGFKDYANTFDTNSLTLDLNGSDKAGGSTDNPSLNVEGIAVTLVFIDSTRGWLVTDSGLQSEAPSPTFIAATGGTITTSGNFKVHTFTGPGTFTVCSVGNAAGSNSVDYLVIGGGGGGGACRGGGGGAGGYRESCGGASGCYTTSPLAKTSGAIPVTATGFPIAVGGGGAGSPGRCGPDSVNGAVSTFSTITSAGGGGGGKNYPAKGPGSPGASGGGGVRECGTGTGGTGNTPPVSPPQGKDGGASPGANGDLAGGGGGAIDASHAGDEPTGSPTGTAGNGGAGATSSINGTPTGRAGGGGGGPGGGSNGSGANGGGAGGGANPGTANTGGGGGGGAAPSAAGNGGSGIVIIRYKFQ